MADTWTCAIHNLTLPTHGDEGYCPGCLEDMKNAPDPATMTGDERVAEIDRWEIVSVPFAQIHERIEALVGRPVWTHEMGTDGIERLKQEARERTGKQPSLAQLRNPLGERSMIVRVPGGA